LKKFASVLVLFALLVSACGGGAGESAATVDGTEYTVGEVNELVFDDGATVSKEQFAQFLGFLVQWDIVTRAAEADYGVSFTEEEIADAAQDIYTENAQEGTTFEDFLEANAVSEEFLNKVAHLQLVETGVRVALSEGLDPFTQEDIDTQMEAAVDALTEVCASHILVETEDEANDVLDRLDAGEEFADLAMELSLDTGSGAEGGDLGCRIPVGQGGYVPEFATATLEDEIGVPSAPVETQFGFHIILVYDRTLPADEDLPSEEELIETMKIPATNQALTAWIGSALTSAEVTVNEKFGTWQTEPTAGVVPPTDEPASTTTAPDATTTTVPATESTTTQPDS